MNVIGNHQLTLTPEKERTVRGIYLVRYENHTIISESEIANCLTILQVGSNDLDNFIFLRKQ